MEPEECNDQNLGQEKEDAGKSHFLAMKHTGQPGVSHLFADYSTGL